MGFIPTMLGIGGNGANFQAQQGTTSNNVTEANQQALNAIQQQQAFANAVAAQNGLGNLANVYGQYQGIANGTGPNPALAMMSQATGQNNAAQAALMAGNRGASANAGLIAREAAQQGAANQQQNIANAANMQAQQQLNALGAMGTIAGQQAGMQQNAVMGLNQAAQGNQTNLASQLNDANTANAGVAQQNAKTQGGIFGGVMNSIGGALGLAGGGQVPSLGVNLAMPTMPAIPFQHANIQQSHQAPNLYAGDSSDPITQGTSNMLDALFNLAGGAGGAPVVAEAHGGPIDIIQHLTGGSEHVVPGQANVPGDSYANDKVPAMLSPGEIVVPRSKAANPEQAAAFARAVSMRANRGRK